MAYGPQNNMAYEPPLLCHAKFEPFLLGMGVVFNLLTCGMYP